MPAQLDPALDAAPGNGVTFCGLLMHPVWVPTASKISRPTLALQINVKVVNVLGAFEWFIVNSLVEK